MKLDATLKSTQNDGSHGSRYDDDDLDGNVDQTVAVDIVHKSVLINDQYKILWCNDDTISNLRNGLDDVIGLDCFTVLTERDDPCSTCPAISVRKNGNPSFNRVVCKSRESEYVFAYPQINEDGQSTNTIMVIHQSPAAQATQRPAKNHRRLRSLIGNVPDILGIIDNCGTLLLTHSPSGFLPTQSSIGSNIFDILLPIDPSDVHKRLSEVFAKGEMESFDIEVEGETQETEVVNLTLWPLIEDDHVEQAYVVARNISWEDETISAIVDTEEQFRAIFNEAEIGIILITEHKKIMDVNKTCTRIIGFSADELLTMGIADITHPDDRSWVDDKFHCLLMGDCDTIDFESRLLRKDREHVWVHINATIHRDRDQKPDYVIVMMEDITRRKETEDAFRYHTEYEQMLQDISAKFNNIASYEIEVGVHYALRHVSIFMDASAIFVCLTSDGKGNCSLNYTWMNDKFMTLLPHESTEEEEPRAQYLGKLVQRLWSPDSVEGSFDVTEAKKAIVLREAGLGSCFVVPLFSRGNILGYIGMWADESDKEWKEKDSDILYSVGQILSFALHRKNLWEDSHSFFNESSDLLCIINKADKRLLKMNPSFMNLLNLHMDDVRNKSMFEFVHPADRRRLDYHLDGSVVSNQPSEIIQVRMITDDGNLKWVEIMCKPSPDESTIFYIARDVTEKKRTLMDLKRREMRYRIEEGRITLEKEQDHPVLKDVIRDLIDIGYQGYVFSRNPNPEIGVDGTRNLTLYWLAETDHDRSISPSINSILQIIKEFPNGSVILIDRLDYLISKNGFDDVLAFVHRLGEIAYLNEHIVLVNIDPMTISSQQLRMIEKECTDLQPIHTQQLNTELMDLLRIAHFRKITNLNTSYEDFTKELRISKPTARKRLATLVYMDYMIECVVGRKKVFSLTDKALNLLSG